MNPACKFAGGIRELHAAPIKIAIYRWENLNLNKKIETTFKNRFTVCGPYTYQGLSNQTTFRRDLKWCYGTFNEKWSRHMYSIVVPGIRRGRSDRPPADWPPFRPGGLQPPCIFRSENYSNNLLSLTIKKFKNTCKNCYISDIELPVTDYWPR